MNAEPEPELTRVAEAVGEGRAVDWLGETTTRPEIRTLLEELRLIEAVAAAHQAVRDGGTEPPSTGSAQVGAGPAVEPRGEPGGLPEGGTAWGPLRILDRIGRGGFADVFRAFDPTLEREVALKLLRPDASHPERTDELSLREARRLALVRHPNVVTVFGADRHDGRVGLWTEILTGQTLEEILAERGRFSAREAALIGIDVCRALAAVHAQKLVHRDIKASNIMREEGGRIVLMDFGATTNAPGPVPGRLGDSLPAGTPLTMAPEQLRGERATVASDIYGIGVLLYRLVSGHYPIEGDDYAALLARHARGAITPLRDVRPDLPDDLVRTVERAIHSDPLQRFESAGVMERALVGVLATAPWTAPQAGRLRTALRWLGRRPILAGAALVSVVVVLALVALALRWPAGWSAGRPGRTLGLPVHLETVSVSTAPGNQSNPMLAADGQGGAFVAWQDDQGGRPDVIVQRLNHAGLPRWPARGVAVSEAAHVRGLTNRAGWGQPRAAAIVADGSGGALVVWHERREATGLDIYGQRLLADGRVAPGWPAQGAALCAAPGDQMDAVLVADGRGGALVTWRDARPGASSMDIHMQRVTADGAVAPGWPADGIAVCSADGDQQLPALVGDGTGGAIVVWYDYRDDWAGDIFAQRVSGAGRPLWAANGVRVCGATGLQRESMVVPDGAGGAVICWQDHRGSDYDVYAQRLTAQGAPAAGWPKDGIAVCAVGGHQKAAAVTADAAAGTRVAWVDFRRDSDGDIYLQELDARGRLRWGRAGLPVCLARGGQRQPSLASDGRGGTLLAWTDYRREHPGEPPSPADIYAQRVDARGVAQWAPNGTPVCTAAGNQQFPVILSDGGEGAFLAWPDYRSGSFSDLFAATVSAYTPRASKPREASDRP